MSTRGPVKDQSESLTMNGLGYLCRGSVTSEIGTGMCCVTVGEVTGGGSRDPPEVTALSGDRGSVLEELGWFMR